MLKSPLTPSYAEANRGPRRLAVLYSRLTAYMASCLRALNQKFGTEILVIRYAPAKEAPFEARTFDWIGRLHDRRTMNLRQMQDLLKGFSPDAALVSGWVDAEYVKLARTLRKQGVLVIAGLDGQWKGSPRQQLARLAAPWYVQPAFDVLWVAGERQRQFAARLGFTGTRCWSGVYACDWNEFASVSKVAWTDRPRAFLFVGRYVQAKGLDILVSAYESYRRDVEAPWPLICAGTGAEIDRLRGVSGIVDAGFVQPENLPGLMGQASVFVLPSRHEPWGVVLQEAAVAGLPLIASTACGAAVHLLRENFNGLLFQSEDVEHLAECLTWMSTQEGDVLEAMGARSHVLSSQYTPDLWASTLVRGWEEHNKQMRLEG